MLRKDSNKILVTSWDNMLYSDIGIPFKEFAISGYLKIVSECPSPFSWSDLAIAYFATDNFDKAVICGKKSAELLENETHSKAIQKRDKTLSRIFHR